MIQSAGNCQMIYFFHCMREAIIDLQVVNEIHRWSQGQDNSTPVDDTFYEKPGCVAFSVHKVFRYIQIYFAK